MSLGAVLTGILPSLGVFAIFAFVMRGIVRADRNERDAIAASEREHAARMAAGAPEQE